MNNGAELFDRRDVLVIPEIFLIGFGAEGDAVSIKMQSVAVFTHPAHLFGRITHPKGIGWNIFGHYASGTDQCVCADPVSADDSRIGSDGRTFFNISSPEFFYPVNKTAGIGYVGKYTGRPQKNVVFANYSWIERNIVLDLHSISDLNARTDKYILSDIASLAALPPATAARTNNPGRSFSSGLGTTTRARAAREVLPT